MDCFTLLVSFYFYHCFVLLMFLTAMERLSFRAGIFSAIAQSSQVNTRMLGRVHASSHERM